MGLEIIYYLLFIEYEIMAFKKIPSPEEVKANSDAAYSYGHWSSLSISSILVPKVLAMGLELSIHIILF